jgi:LysM repeat protein
MPPHPRNNRPLAIALGLCFAAILCLAAALAKSHATNKKLAAQNSTLTRQLSAIEKNTKTTAAALGQFRISQNARNQENAAQLATLNTRVATVEQAAVDVLGEVATEITEIHQTLAANNIRPNPAAAETGGTYIVQPDDTAETIADITGVSPAALQSANPNTILTALHPGQLLNLPPFQNTPPPDNPPSSE